MRIGRESWILGALLLVFILASVVLTQQSSQTEEKKRPSSYNATRAGTRALYDLLARQHFDTRRFERPLTELPPDAALLAIFEPLERPLQNAEASAMQSWLDRGGTLLLVAQPLLDTAMQTGLGFEEARTAAYVDLDTVAEIDAKSPYARDVSQIKINGAGSVEIEKPKTVEKLISSGGTVYGATWREKKGRVVYLSSAVALTNGWLQQGAADNAVFLLNVAQEAAKGRKPVVLFDEYHQGFGIRKSVDRSLWAAIGPALRAVAWYSLIGFCLLVYALNRRFGPVKTLPAVDYRSSTEYIASMAALYQRSGAGLLALETILRDFLRDLSNRLEMNPTAAPEMLAQAAQKRWGWNPDDLAFTIRRSGDLIASPEPTGRAMEQEITQLAQRLHTYRTEIAGRKV